MPCFVTRCELLEEWVIGWAWYFFYFTFNLEAAK